MKKRYIKGQYEYAKYNKIYETVKTIIMFALSFGVYFLGIKIAGSNKNYLTILAVLGLLPASKSLVSMIMAYRIKVTDLKFKDNINNHIHDLFGMYHLLFTSDDKNYFIDHLVITKNAIIGYSSDIKFDSNSFNKHINKHLKMDSISDITIKIFTDQKNYLNRLEEISTNTNIVEPNAKVTDLIFNISL